MLGVEKQLAPCESPAERNPPLDVHLFQDACASTKRDTQMLPYTRAHTHAPTRARLRLSVTPKESHGGGIERVPGCTCSRRSGTIEAETIMRTTDRVRRLPFYLGCTRRNFFHPRRPRRPSSSSSSFSCPSLPRRGSRFSPFVERSLVSIGRR